MVLRIIVAAFAVLGVYFFAKVLWGMIFPNRHLIRSVIIDRRENLMTLDLILDEIKAYELCTYKNKIIVAIDSSVFSLCSEEEQAQLYKTIEQKSAKIIIY